MMVFWKMQIVVLAGRGCHFGLSLRGRNPQGVMRPRARIRPPAFPVCRGGISLVGGSAKRARILNSRDKGAIGLFCRLDVDPRRLFMN